MSGPMRRNAEEILEALERAAHRIKRAFRERQDAQAQKIRDNNRRITETDSDLAPEAPARPRKTKLPRRGEPGSYGYDDKGKRLPYANNRPKYDEGQVETVWKDTHDAQVRDAGNGSLVDQHGNPLPAPGKNQVWVQRTDDSWDLVTWTKGEPRTGTWDMGHRQDAKYSELRDDYLSGDISKEEFLAEYRDPGNYVVQDPDRNRSHMDE